MATCKIGKFKFSLHMKDFQSEVGFPVLFVSSQSVKINLRQKRKKKIRRPKKIKYFPFFVCELHGERERAAVLKAVITVINPAHILFLAQTLNDYIYIYIC